MELSSKEKKALRGEGQLLEPVLTIGKKGVTPEVLKALESCFTSTHLVKISIDAEREQRDDWAKAVAEALGAEIVGQVGKAVLLYRVLS